MTILAYKMSEVTSKLSESLARVARQQSSVNRLFVETFAEAGIKMKQPPSPNGDKPEEEQG